MTMWGIETLPTIGLALSLTVLCIRLVGVQGTSYSHIFYFPRSIIYLITHLMASQKKTHAGTLSHHVVFLYLKSVMLRSNIRHQRKAQKDTTCFYLNQPT